MSATRLIPSLFPRSDLWLLLLLRRNVQAVKPQPCNHFSVSLVNASIAGWHSY